MRALVLLLLLSTGPALADPPLTGAEFDAMTLGRSMTWSEFGSVYGVEQYLPDRRVRWAAVGKDCKLGHWYEDGAAICFKYEDDIQPDCWIITRGADGFSASYATQSPETAPVVVAETPDPPACFGPEVGA